MKKNLEKGFSLTELSVSLAIIAMIVGSAISVAVNNDYSVKEVQTKLKISSIEDALTGYFVANKRLPCPADGEDLITDINFGVEKINTSSNPAVCNVTLATGSNFLSGNIVAGVVPVTTLQLPDDFMFDGWGRRIMYVVDQNFVNNKTTNNHTSDNDCNGGECFVDTEDGVIIVNDASGSVRTSKAVYVLVSYGENGHGAFIKNGSTTRINAYGSGPYDDVDSDEEENAHFNKSGTATSYDSVFVSKEYIKSISEYFDDIVAYRQKSQIIKDTGELFYDEDCRSATLIDQNIGELDDNDCHGADDKDMCESFASEIVKHCILDE